MRKITLSLAFALVGLLTGCATQMVPLHTTQAIAQAGQAQLEVRLVMGQERSTQLAGPEPWPTTIAQLEIVPYIFSATNGYEPMTATGATTTEGADNQHKLTVLLDGRRVNYSVTFKNLHHQKRYRILARAYDENGTRISVDQYSYANIQTLNNDRPTLVSLPVRFVNTVFSATSSLEVRLSRNGQAHHAQVGLYTITYSGEEAVPGATASIQAGEFPKTIDLGNLGPNTNYMVRVSVENASNFPFTNGMAFFNVGEETAVPTQSLCVTVPYYAMTLAGNGQEGYVNQMTGLSSQFNLPAFSVIAPDGNLLVTDYGNHAIRKIDVNSGATTTYAGTGARGSKDGNITGDPAQATFSDPNGMVYDTQGNLYVLESSPKIRRIEPDGDVVTIPLPGVIGQAIGLGIDPLNNLYVSTIETGITPALGRIYKVTPASVIEKIAHAGPLRAPFGMVANNNNELFVADQFARAVFKIDLTTKAVTLVAGGTLGSADGNGAQAQFFSPRGILLKNDGTLLVSDLDNGNIRAIAPNGDVTTVATGVPGIVGISRTADDVIYGCGMFSHQIYKLN